MDATNDGSTPPTVTDDPTPEDGSADGARGPAGRSRRWFVAGGLALIVGGGAGVAVGFARGTAQRSPRPVPTPVRTALADEAALLAAARAAQHDSVLAPRVAAALVSDHAAHLAALQAAAADYSGAVYSGGDSSDATASPTPPQKAARTAPEPRRTLAALRALEQGAADRAAERAAALAAAHDAPSAAALLASIAACEATHVQVLA